MAGPWFVKSGTGGLDDGTSWANAAESITGLLAAQTVAAGEIIYCHNTHNNNAGVAISWTMPESGTGVVQVLSVDGGDATGASLSGTTVGNLYAGATECTNGNAALSITGSTNTGLYFYGMTFKAGPSGASANQAAADISLFASSGTNQSTFDNCLFWMNSTNTGANLLVSAASNNGHRFNFVNCTFRHEATNPSVIIPSGGVMTFVNCIIHTSSSTIGTLFAPAAGRQSAIICTGCDWSKATNLYNQAGAGSHSIFANNCVIGTPTTGTHVGLGGPVAEFHACGPADGSYGPDLLAYYYEDVSGTVEDTCDNATGGTNSIYLTTGGAQGKQDDGTLTSYALKMTPRDTSTVLAQFPLYTPWFYTFVGSTGSKTFTVQTAHTESAVLKDIELWLEVEYVGGSQVANSPQFQREGTHPVVTSTISRDVVVTGSNLTDTSAAWTGITSEKTHALAKTVTVDEQGYVRCRVALAKDTTNAVYVDPKIAVS